VGRNIKLSAEEIEQLSLDRLSNCELLVIAEYYLESDKKDKAMELFAQVAESDEFDPCIDYFNIFEELINYWRNKDIDKLFTLCNIVCVKFLVVKNTTRIWTNAIWLTFILLRGIKIFEKLINRNPDNIWNHNCAALSLQEGGEYQLAEKYIREGINNIKPDI